MRKRGISDFDKVQIDGWAVGQVAAAHEGVRLLRALSYFKGDAVNFYGQPIEGVVALVNMNTNKVIIGNYDYALNWIFHQDGVLEADAALSGIMLPKGVPQTKANAHGPGFKSGHLVSANIVAPHHQHFFSFRLDLDVDGPNNSVHEMNTRAVPPGPTNPFFNGILMQETILKTERQAQRRMSMPLARTWMVVNPTTQNALGHHTSYILVPGSNSLPYIAPTSQVRRRAGFINNHFWATRYKPDEMSAAGVYPNQSRGGDGLPRWIGNNEDLVDQDVVVWYTLGVTHIPRPEEWPVMPVTHVGFKMIPGGFFSRNPALDVPK